MTPGILKRQDSASVGFCRLCVQADDWPQSWKRWKEIMVVGEETISCAKWIDVRMLFSFSILKVKAVHFFYLVERGNSDSKSSNTDSKDVTHGCGFALYC